MQQQHSVVVKQGVKKSKTFSSAEVLNCHHLQDAALLHHVTFLLLRKVSLSTQDNDGVLKVSGASLAWPAGKVQEEPFEIHPLLSA